MGIRHNLYTVYINTHTHCILKDEHPFTTYTPLSDRIKRWGLGKGLKFEILSKYRIVVTGDYCVRRCLPIENPDTHTVFRYSELWQ